MQDDNAGNEERNQGCQHGNKVKKNRSGWRIQVFGCTDWQDEVYKRIVNNSIKKRD